MEKTVLIPTDFSIASLNIVKSYMSMQKSDIRINVILLHGLQQSDSITSLLFYSKRRLLEELCTKEFREGCTVLKNKYASQVRTIKTDIFSGLTQSAFDKFTEANAVTEICLPLAYKPKFKNKNSFDLLPYFKASGLPIEIVGTEVDVQMPEKGKVAELFFNRVSVS